MADEGTKGREQKSMTLSEVMRDGQELTQRFVKSLDIMCAAGIDIDYLVDGEPVKGFPKTLRFKPLTYGDMAEMVQRRKADALKLYRDNVYSSTVTARQRFQDLHVILVRLATPDDFSFADPANVRNAVQLSLTRGHCTPGGKPCWKPSLEQVDEILADESFKNLVSDVVKIEMRGPCDTGSSDKEDQKEKLEGDDGAENPTMQAERAETTASKTTPT